MREVTVCPACGADGLQPFHRVESMPAASCLLADDGEEARSYPRGAIELALCRACGFITNTRFDPSIIDYSSSYEETQSFSPRFRRFAGGLTSRLVDGYGIRNKTVLEIGCGRGDFLAMLCEAGNNRGIGIDPSYRAGDIQSPALERIQFIPEFYGEQHAGIEADLICCRHTLEHVQPTTEFLRMVRRSIGDRDTVVFFEVPDVARVLRDLSVWDIHYEHCSYFTLGALARQFRAADFDVLELELGYEDQYCLIVARPSRGQPTPPLPAENDLGQTVALVERFQQIYPQQLEKWRAQLQRIRQSRKRAVIWGGGSKAVSYLSLLGVTDEVAFVVDINPQRQGQFLAGPGHQILPPAELQRYRPDVVIVMNPIYLDEIGADLEKMGLQPELVPA
ncbi:MAG: methyltransferase domain-containing protein [Chloroflexi bacterium]|nr:methyltransferase domain-containing protein [Chloroflexota bacterium]